MIKTIYHGSEKIIEKLREEIKIIEESLAENWSWLIKIRNTKEELEFAKSHEALYLSWIEQGKAHFEPTKTYDIKKDDTDI